MTRSPVSLLSRLGHVHEPSISLSLALLHPFDGAAAISDGCSTSSRSTLYLGNVGAWAGVVAQQRRSYAKPRANLAQPVDTNYINELLSSATVLEHAALPVLQYGAWFDPEQVTRTLQRVPRMLRHQRLKGAAAPSDTQTARVLLLQLGTRLAEVAPHCSDEQLARALWAFGVSRQGHTGVVRAACELLPQRLGSMSVPHLATAAWGLVAATCRDGELRKPVQQLLQTVAQHLVASRPASLAASQPPSLAALPSGAASPAPATAATVTTRSPADGSGSALVVDAPWMDHRSALKLAWAFATAEVTDAQALDLIGDAAAARMASQLQSHDWSSGPLAARATYIYRTIRGLQAWPRPRPPRGGSAAATRRSRYLRDERPRVVLRDFTPGTLAPLLSAFRRLGHRHEGLLKAAGEHLAASSGPSLSLPARDLARLVGAMDSLGLRHPAALAALLAASHLAPLPAPALIHLTGLAADWGVRQKALYGRLVRQLVSRAWVVEDSVPVGGAGIATAGAAAGATDLAVVDEQQRAAEAAAAEAMKAAAAAAARQEVRVDPRALESWEQGPGLLVSWRTDPAELAAEDREWAVKQRNPRDRVSAAQLAGVLLKLAKIGFPDPHADLIVPLFALLYPHLPHLPRDAAAGVALAAVHYGDLLDHASPAHSSAAPHVPYALDLIRESTRVALYGTVTGPSKPHYLRSLYENAGAGAPGGSSGVAGSEDQAAQLRASMGLTHAGAMRLAEALTVRPNAVSEKDLKVALSLLDLSRTSRGRLGQLVARLRQRGLNGALPPRVLAAVGEPSG